ncbi:hypothetical protein BDZ89DRAFT_1044887 [Hymenopellis radicata]|nr:hypothetical protein BDZ89DRAFT_1044887 [Hymenopellis radicata]
MGTCMNEDTGSSDSSQSPLPASSLSRKTGPRPDEGVTRQQAARTVKKPRLSVPDGDEASDSEHGEAESDNSPSTFQNQMLPSYQDAKLDDDVKEGLTNSHELMVIQDLDTDGTPLQSDNALSASTSSRIHSFPWHLVTAQLLRNVLTSVGIPGVNTKAEAIQCLNNIERYGVDDTIEQRESAKQKARLLGEHEHQQTVVPSNPLSGPRRRSKRKHGAPPPAIDDLEDDGYSPESDADVGSSASSAPPKVHKKHAVCNRGVAAAVLVESCGLVPDVGDAELNADMLSYVGYHFTQNPSSADLLLAATSQINQKALVRRILIEGNFVVPKAS